MPYPLRPLVIIPTYNERANIAQIIPAILQVDDRLHVLIVDDASPDNTGKAVLDLKATAYPDRVNLHSRLGKRGLGSAYVDGFNWGLERGYDFLIQMDADWSHNPADLEKMLESAGRFDFVVASRYVQGGSTLNWGFGRKSLSRLASVYSRLILGSDFADFTGGFNGWSGRLLQAINVDSLRSDGYSFQDTSTSKSPLPLRSAGREKAKCRWPLLWRHAGAFGSSGWIGDGLPGTGNFPHG
jgi:dolichol-phosphate mannosyltransferase